MNRSDDFELIVSAWLHDDAEHRVPDHVAAVLRRTDGERQRPAWSSLERWLPVQASLRFVPAPRIAWVLVILAVLVALAAVALSVGSRQRHVPPPFGPARNGLVVYGASDHAIRTLDSVTGATAALITGSASDRSPTMSSDGTRFFFLRDSAIADPALGTPEPMIMIANVDGSDVRALTGPLPGFQPELEAWAPRVRWSNDGTRIAVALDVNGKAAIEIFAVDGSAKPVVADTGGRSATFIAFRPGDRELTFNGSAGDVTGLYAVGTDGHGLRTILEPANADFASLSPDGKELAYAAPGGGRNAYNVLFVVDVDSGLSRMPAFDPPVVGQGEADAQSWWSPDGTRLLVQRYVGNTYRMAVASASGGPVVEFGPQMLQNGGQRVEAQFSPDGTQVLVHYDDGGATWLLDPTGASPGRKLSSTIAALPTWQRLAVAP